MVERVFASQRLTEEEDYFLQTLEATRSGRWYLDSGQLVSVEHVRPGRWGVGHCHANSRWLSRRWPDRYRWWTGYALSNTLVLGLVENHSWVQRLDGTYMEVTYPAPATLYIGVPVPDGFQQGTRCLLHPNECLAFSVLGFTVRLPLTFR